MDIFLLLYRDISNIYGDIFNYYIFRLVALGKLLLRAIIICTIWGMKPFIE